MFTGYNLFLKLYFDLWTNKELDGKDKEDNASLFIGLSSLGENGTGVFSQFMLGSVDENS